MHNSIRHPLQYVNISVNEIEYLKARANNFGPFNGPSADRVIGFGTCPPPATLVTSADLAQQAEALAVKEAEAAATVALNKRIDGEFALANATIELLSSIRIVMRGDAPGYKSVLAKFRKELQPLAETYGVKIVLIGDKSVATLALK